MKYALITAMLAGLVCVGCNQPPKQTTYNPDLIPAAPGDMVKPMTPPGGEFSSPAPATSLTSLVPPEPRPLPHAPIAPAPAAGGTYTIKKGDTFIKIAREVYGDPGRMKDIAAANPSVNPGKLKVGQTITLPDVGPRK